MTLIVGIVCKDGIVLAADSQTTKGSYIGAGKSCNTDKINVCEFFNGKALIAESGSAALSAKAIAIVQRNAKGINIENSETIAKAVESAVREVRSTLSSLHVGSVTPNDLQEYFANADNYFELMVAYYFDGKPYLCKFNPVWCIPVFLNGKKHFETSGIASGLAEYIITEHTEPEMDSEFASVIAIKTIEDAIEYIEGCGKPTRVALIKPPMAIPDLSKTIGANIFNLPSYNWTDPVTIFPPEKVEKIAKIILSVEKKVKTTQNSKIHRELRKRAQSTFKQLAKMVVPSRPIPSRRVPPTRKSEDKK